MTWLKQNWFKVVAVAILLGAMSEHPYAYYQVLRWVVTLAAAFAAIQAHEHGRQGWMWIFIAMAIL